MDNEDSQSPKSKKDNGRWYPGKLVGKAMRRSSTSSHAKNSSHHGDDNTISSQASHDIGDSYADGESLSNSFSGSNPMNEDQDKEGKEPRKVSIVKTRKLGKVILTVHEVRYLAVQASKFLVELDGVLETNLIYSDTGIPYTKEYDFTDISSDLKIEFRGVHMTTTKTVSGFIILPLSQCLSVTGKPVKLAKKWYELYPFYDRTKLGEPPKVTKFRTGYPEIPGSALQKFNFPLGFVSLEMEIQLAPDVKNGFSLYFFPSLSMNNIRYDEEADVNESNLVLTNARMNRDIERIKNVLFRPIACVAPFLSFPEVFPLILLFFFFCHGITFQQFPLAISFLAFFNGIIAATNRSYNNVLVWNEPGVALAFNAAGAILPAVKEEESVSSRASISSSISINTTFSTMISILKNSQLLQKKIHEAAHTLEIWTNVFTFADARVSLIAYGVLFAVAIFLTLLLYIFSISTVIALVGSVYFILLAADEFVDEQIAGLSKQSVYWKYIYLYRSTHHTLECVLSKVPDSLELTHRNICSRQVVKEGGAEMLDAQDVHEKNDKKEK